MVKKKDAQDLTKEEQKIVEETLKQEEKEELPPKIGIVLTGGIDSTTLLYKLKKEYPRKDIQPIIITDDPEDKRDKVKAIKTFTDELGIETSPKTFVLETKADMKNVLQWCEENNVSPLYFGTNYEESLAVKAKGKDVLNELKMVNPNVVLAEPFAVVNKSEIIKMANEYGILNKTLEPSYKGADGSKLKKIRQEAFATANQLISKPDEKIVDPHETV